jgi:GNAT superfamily N-acetyltransferase
MRMSQPKLRNSDLLLQDQVLEDRLLSADDRENIRFLLPLSPDYPGIEHWYVRKVMPGQREGTRKIIRIERQGRLVAIGIGKKERSEYKICTVRVAPEYFGRGLGIRLFGELMDWMETDRPHLTISESKLVTFASIFSRFGYQLTSTHNGLYRPGRVELLYNEATALAWRQEDKYRFSSVVPRRRDGV